MVRKSCQLLLSEPGKQWESSSKHSLIGNKSLPEWGAESQSKAKEESLSILCCTLMRVF